MPEIIELYVESLAEHGFTKHAKDLRSEKSNGNPLSLSQYKGEPISVFEKQTFKDHLRDTLNDPDTKYFIDDVTGRMVS